MGIPAVGIQITGDPSGAQHALKSVEGELKGFKGQVQSQFSKLGGSLKGMLGGAIVGAFSISAISAGLKYAFEQSDALDASNRKLAATAKLAGQNLGFLQKTAQDAQQTFGLSARDADEFTISLTKLTSRAGKVEDTGAAIGALLDLAAAKGMGANEALEAINETLAGQDEGTDKLFQKNPSQIYAEWAKKAGVAASKMTSAQQAQALLDAVLHDGTVVRGEYAKWLESASGQQYLLQVKTDQAAAALGRSMNGIRTAVLPVLADLAVGFVKVVTEMRIFIARLPVLKGHVALWAAELNDSWGGAVEGMSSKIVSFYDWSKTLPEWVQWMFGFKVARGVGIQSFARFIDQSTKAGVDAAKRNLEQLRKEFEVEAARIRQEMSLATQITGDTNPLNNRNRDSNGDGTGTLTSAQKKELGGLDDFDPFHGGKHLLGGRPRADREDMAGAVQQTVEHASKLKQVLGELPSIWQDAVGGAFDLREAVIEVTHLVADGLFNGLTAVFDTMIGGSKEAGAAFKAALVGAIRDVALHEARLALGEMVLAAARFIGGDVRQAAAVAKYAAAAAALLAVAAAAGGGGGGAGASAGAGSSVTSSRQDVASQGKGDATIVLKGSWKALLSDPDAQDSFADLIGELSDRRVVVMPG